ncbi:hypothetical protein HSBGL_1827 [Halapricum desulfuricans]|uniref:Uncharacterized protein n=1 Tax=Halapricum desulfuricans TaxID=2841257 RepID=A0A897NI12_9EURY|nr:hypothetical protein [Halapricum desulfuricans]QSG12238.1 hypothetical protein HSBGL_1827 [Halapricum desulfuricans]
MDEVFDIFELDLGELLESGLQAVLAVLLLAIGIGLMLAAIVVDGVFLWGLLLFVGGIVVGVFSVISFFDTFL